MALNIGKEMAALKRMTVPELRRQYARVFGEDTTSRHKEYLIRRIIWRLQVNEEGGLSERAKRRARNLAAGSDVRLTAPPSGPAQQAGESMPVSVDFPQDDRLPMPGAIITRRYKNQTVAVRVLPRGFEYEGEVYRTLSAVAKKVTSTHWNGYTTSLSWARRDASMAGRRVEAPAIHAQFTPARAQKKVLSRSSTASMPNARPAKHLSRARRARAGSAFPIGTTTADLPVATWSALRSNA